MATPIINLKWSFWIPRQGLALPGWASFGFGPIPPGKEFWLVPVAFDATPRTQILLDQYGEPTKTPNAPGEYGAEQMKPMPDFSGYKNAFSFAARAIGRDRSSELHIAV